MVCNTEITSTDLLVIRNGPSGRAQSKLECGVQIAENYDYDEDLDRKRVMCQRLVRAIVGMGFLQRSLVMQEDGLLLVWKNSVFTVSSTFYVDVVRGVVREVIVICKLR